MDIFEAMGKRFSFESEGESHMTMDEAFVIDDETHVDEGDCAHIEACDAMAEANGYNAVAEQLQDTAAALESFLDKAKQDRVTASPWDAQTARISLMSVNLIAGKQTRVISQSTESYQTRVGALGAMMSVENAIWDALKDLWQKLKGMMTKMMDSIREFFIKHFSQLGAMKKKAEAVKKKAEAGGKIGKGKAKMSNFGQMHIANAAPAFDKIKETLDEYVGFAQALSDPPILSGYAKCLEDLTEICEDATVERFVQAYPEMRKSIFAATYAGEMFDKVKGQTPIDLKTDPSKIGAQDDEIAYASDEIMGGLKFFFILKKDSFPETLPDSLKQNPEDMAKTVKDWMTSIRLLLVPANADNKREHDSEKEVPRIQPGQVSSLCGSIISFCEAGLRYKNSWDQYDQSTKKFIARMDKISLGAANTGSDTDEAIDVRLRGNIAGGAASWVRGVATALGNINRLGGQASRNVLNLCISSIDPSDH